MKQLGRTIGLATEIGMAMGLTAAGFTLLGLWAGRWLDTRLGTSPILTITLIITGAVAGQIAIYRLARDSIRRLSQAPERVWYLREAVSAIGLAIRVLALLALPSLVGIALGLWIDHMAGTGILVTVILVLGGLVVGLLGTLRLVRSAEARRRRER